VCRQPHAAILAAITAAAALAAGAQPAAAAAPTVGRTAQSALVAGASWHVQEGCLVTQTQLTGYDVATTSRTGDAAFAEVGIWINSFDTCTGQAVSSWQGSVRPDPGALAVAADLGSAAVRAQIPVTDWVSGATDTVAVDVRLESTGLAADNRTISHFRAPGIVANYTASFLGHDARVGGSILLAGRELATGSFFASIYVDAYAQTLIDRQAMLARAFAGVAGSGPVGLSTEGVHATWSDLDDGGCLVTETTVIVQDFVGWDGTREAWVAFYRIERDDCAGRATGMSGVLTLDDVSFSLASTSKASLEGTLTATRDDGEQVPVSLELAWTGIGTRSVWQLTQQFATTSGRSTSHHNEAWRGADVSGRISVGGTHVDPGALSSAGFHQETNIVTNA
jgi:hypothetical protein